MKTEFRCADCQRLLRAPIVYIGVWTRCPVCDHSQMIPKSAHPPVLTAGSATVDRYSNGTASWSPQTVTLKSILQDAWALYLEHLWTLLAVSFIDLLLWIIGVVLILVPAVGTFAVLWKAIGVPPPLSLLGMFVVLALGFMSLINAMVCSHAKFYLKIARGEHATLWDAFHIGWRRGAVTMLPTVFTVVCLTGLALCIAPGVLVYMFFWPYIWVWADRQAEGHESQAFPMARDLTSRNLTTTFAITGIGILMSLFGFKVFGQSLTGVLKAVAYLRMSGQEVTGIRHRIEYPQLTLEGADPA